MDLRIEVHGHGERRLVAVGSEKARQRVERQVNAVVAFGDEDRDRRVRCRVWDPPGHFLHDERVTDEQPEELRLVPAPLRAQDFARVEAAELHQTRRTDGLMNHVFQFGDRSGLHNRLVEIAHVWMA